MATKPLIQQRTVLCQELFQRFSDAYPADEWFENRQADFQLWSSGIGASIIGKASLDYRVRSYSETRNKICDYLDGLTELLQRHLQSTEDELGSVDSDDTGDADFFDPAGAAFNETRIAVKSILQALSRISSAIRRAGTRFRFKAADDSLDVEKLSEVKRMYSLYIFRDQGPRRQLLENQQIEKSERERQSTEDFCDTALSSEWMMAVHHQLVRANLLRHNRMLYSTESMRRKSGKKTEEGFLQNTAPRTPVVLKKSPEDDPRRPLQVPSNTTTEPGSQSGKTHTPSAIHTATDLGSQYDEESALKRTAPSVFTQGTQTGTSLEYPRCPKPTSDGVIQCPYCGDILTEDYYANKSRWRGHVAQDLLPYSCVVEDCTCPDEMYGTSTELENHMYREHHVKRWTCQHCNSLATAQKAQLFETEDEWKEHMSQTHVDALPSQQLVLLSKLAVRSTIPELLCPFCQSSGEAAACDFEHVVHCLHRFALIALPPSPHHPQDPDGKSRSSSGGAVVLGGNSQDSRQDSDQRKQDLESFHSEAGESNEWNFEVTGLDERDSRDIIAKLTSETLLAVPYSLTTDSIAAWKSTVHIEEEVTELEVEPASDNISIASDHVSTSSKSSDGQEDFLTNQIANNLVKSAFDGVEFLPEGSIDDHITRDTVSKELEFEDLQRNSEANNLVNFVLYEAKKVFAICLMVGFSGKDLRRAMSQFMRLGFQDISLPATDEIVYGVPFFGLQDSLPHKPWNRVRVHNFRKNQWLFLAPVFSRHIYEVDLHSSQVLPFVSIGNEVHKNQFSQIYKVMVHPSHYKYPISENNPQIYNVALKQLKSISGSSVEREWRKEIAVNQDISGHDHPNIVRFLAAITRGNNRYLMYEWANGGNLRELWQKCPHPILSRRLVEDVLQQLRGLAAALDSLHNSREGSHYRHGDLKPENILRFRRASQAEDELDVGLLKLSGLGLARNHTTTTQSRPPTSTRYTTHRYQPPETVTVFNQARSRKYDIWSIGCIMLELIVWILYGYEELKKFEESITGDFHEPSAFYVVSDTDKGRIAKIHPAVNATLDALIHDPECSADTALGNLLQLIKTKLLIVDLARRITPRAATTTIHIGEKSNIDSRVEPSILVSDYATAEQQAIFSTEGLSFRCTATDLLRAIDEIISKGNGDDIYWYTGKSPDHMKYLQISSGRPVLSAEKTGPLYLSPLDLSPLDLSPLLTRPSSKVEIVAVSSSGDDEPKSQTENSLGDRLREALVQTIDGKIFWPRDTLLTILTESRVCEELDKSLGNYNKDKIRQISGKICETVKLPEEFVDESPNRRLRSFHKIFAILVIIEETSNVVKFLQEDVNDSDLPLIKVPNSEKRGRIELRIHRFPKTPLQCFVSWSQIAIENFEQWQWSTVAPFFSNSGIRKSVLHYALQDQAILPFIRDVQEIQNSAPHDGGFSSVSKVVIHPQHHNFRSIEESHRGIFAIKRLHSRDRKSFQREVKTLKKFSNYAHQHLISLLATYEHVNTYNLIFPWAEADLTRYWKEINPSPSFDQKTVSWVAEQCRGIVNGLYQIHKYNSSPSLPSLLLENQTVFGRHGDIKPENVLWFPETDGNTLGTLKLSDFGQAELRHENAAASAHSPPVILSPSYRAPESDMPDFRVGQSYDMWTLGCLYLEFVTWLLGGWVLVYEFNRQRLSPDVMWSNMVTDTFFEIRKQKQPEGKLNAVIKPAVLKFINRLHSHASCSEFIHEFLIMIEFDLLVIRPIDPREKGRLTCREIEMKLAQMINSCRASDEFAVNPIPRLWSSTQRAV